MKRDSHCTLCPLHETAEFICLLGNGPRPSEVMIIGEAPGQREDDSGKPFVGRSGQLLMAMLDSVGLDRSNCYITNAVHCRPPDNRTPKKKEITACKKWLDYEISVVKPKYILTLGNVPLQSLLGVSGVKKYRGKPIEKNGVVILPTFHPAFALRDERQKAVIEKDIRAFKDIIDFGGIPEERELNYTIVDTWRKFEDMLEAMTGTIAFDLETSGLYPWHKDSYITSYVVAVRDHQYVVPVNHSKLVLDLSRWFQPKPIMIAQEELKEFVRPYQKSQQKMWDRLIPRLNECEVVTQNGKFDALWVWVKTGHRVRLDFDTMLAHYLIDENAPHDLEYLAALYFGAPGYDISLAEKHGIGSLDRHCKYAASDGFYTRKLKFRLLKELKQDSKVKRVFDKLMMPVANLFVEIEHHGVYINRSKMKDARTYLQGEVAAAQKEWDKYGKGVNMRSPKQIGELLFKKLKIPIVEKTKKGAASTSESVLKRIDHPAAQALLKFRGAAQQLSFFIGNTDDDGKVSGGWEEYIVNERMHPSFKLHGTVTGRPSCENPNLQQVPRDPRIRSLITAPPGWTLLDADLSQIELRIAAWLADEKNMIRMFNQGIDVHWMTCLNNLSRTGAEAELVKKTAKIITEKSLGYGDAIEALGKVGPDAAIEVDKAWKELRKKAKATNFGFLYGMWWKKFKIYARDNYGVNVTDEEAQDARKTFFETFPEFAHRDSRGNEVGWHTRQRRYAQMNGYVRSPFGRKRRLPAAMDRKDTPERAEAQRQAINSPVQSCASDLNLSAALELREKFSPEVMHIVGTVHDAILIEVRDDHVKKVAKRLLDIMKRPRLLDDFEIDIPVPVLGEVKAGPWSEGKTVE